MSSELETAAADSFGELIRRRHKAMPAAGATCANCGVELRGPYCHMCSQDSDTHKRSIGHLIWEAIEGLLHLDGRLLRTIPMMVVKPGDLARDYMEGRIVRHVPPFRTFLVALLLFVFAAEGANHRLQQWQNKTNAAEAAKLNTPQGRAAAVAKMRAEAVKERDDDLKEAANDRDEGLKDEPKHADRVQAHYQAAAKRIQDRYAIATYQADRVSQGLKEASNADARKHLGLPPKSDKGLGPLAEGVKKAGDNPEYYWTVLFAWSHRLAVLLLPILGLTLALVYRNRPRFFIYDHLLVAMNLLSFSFLAYAIALALPPPFLGWTAGLVSLWVPVNLFQTLRGAYGSTVTGALIKTLVVWTITAFSFFWLMVGLIIFTLTQL